MGGVACDGWRFWSLVGTEKSARKPRAATKPKAKKGPAERSRRR